jgi:hypothetical protein
VSHQNDPNPRPRDLLVINCGDRQKVINVMIGSIGCEEICHSFHFILPSLNNYYTRNYLSCQPLCLYCVTIDIKKDKGNPYPLLRRISSMYSAGFSLWKIADPATKILAPALHNRAIFSLVIPPST